MMAEDTGKDRIVPEHVKKRRIRVFLLRHGQVEGHEQFRFHGHTDVPLTPHGMMQVEAAVQYFRDTPLDAVACSDLTRCVEGARRLAAGRNFGPTVLPDLREMNLGVLEGLSYQEVSERHPVLFQEWRDDIVNYRLPEGECFIEASQRILRAFKEMLASREGGRILVVGHGGTNRIILSDALDLDLKFAFRIEQDYGCLNVIDYFPEWTLVKLVNGVLPTTGDGNP